MDYAVKCETFEGPLDLLLYLIKINELDIFNIPIQILTDQYLSHMETVRNINLANIAEFLRMSATLVFIKSKMLLPKKENTEDGEEEDDPVKDLSRRLQAYQMYKEAAVELESMPKLGVDVFLSSFPERIESEIKANIEQPIEGTVDQLTAAFCRVLAELEERKVTHQIKRQEISIDEKMKEILEQCLLAETTFEQLAALCKSRFEIVITFLAILEMVKRAQLEIYQNQPYSPLYLIRRDN